jgi:hypothetical protein
VVTVLDMRFKYASALTCARMVSAAFARASRRNCMRNAGLEQIRSREVDGLRRAARRDVDRCLSDRRCRGAANTRRENFDQKPYE